MINKLQNIQTLNNIFMSYFLNKCEEFGVDFYNSRPTEEITNQFIGNCFVEEDFKNYPFKRYFHPGKMVIEDIDTNYFNNKRVNDFLNEEMRIGIAGISKQFSDICKLYPYSDYIFSALPDYPPLISFCDNDPMTNFNGRAIYGQTIDGKYKLIFEFHCLIINRFRKIDIDNNNIPIVVDVLQMTDEEKEIFDKQPEERE